MSDAFAIAWRCEDEEEALGHELVLERAGLPVRIVEHEGAFLVETETRFAERAAALESDIARHWVRRRERERAAELDRRERWTRRARWASLALGAAALTMLAW